MLFRSVKILGDLNNNSKKHYSKNFKTRCVKRVIENGESAYFVSLDAGLSNKGLIYIWIDNYYKKKYNNNIKKTRRKMIRDKKLTKEEMEDKKALKERIEYLEAENIYLKKLDALMKKKSQKKKK